MTKESLHQSTDPLDNEFFAEQIDSNYFLIAPRYGYDAVINREAYLIVRNQSQQTPSSETFRKTLREELKKYGPPVQIIHLYLENHPIDHPASMRMQQIIDLINNSADNKTECYFHMNGSKNCKEALRVLVHLVRMSPHSDNITIAVCLETQIDSRTLQFIVQYCAFVYVPQARLKQDQASIFIDGMAYLIVEWSLSSWSQTAFERMLDDFQPWRVSILPHQAPTDIQMNKNFLDIVVMCRYKGVNVITSPIACDIHIEGTKCRSCCHIGRCTIKGSFPQNDYCQELKFTMLQQLSINSAGHSNGEN